MTATQPTAAAMRAARAIIDLIVPLLPEDDESIDDFMLARIIDRETGMVATEKAMFDAQALPHTCPCCGTTFRKWESSNGMHNLTTVLMEDETVRKMKARHDESVEAVKLAFGLAT